MTLDNDVMFCDAQVSLCWIYCWTSTNWPFKFVRGIIPGHSSPFWQMTITMTISSNSVLLMHVALAGQYESFEYVKKKCVPSANNFHSCLYALKMCSYHLCCTANVLYSSCSYCILVVLTVYYAIRTWQWDWDTRRQCEWSWTTAAK